MMRFELGLEKPDPKRAPVSAATIAVAYLIGGIVPLTHYRFAPSLRVFAAVKGRFASLNPATSALQTLLVGGLAAAAAYWLAHLFG